MENIILTRNVFITHAFQEMLKVYKCKNICVVDIDSYHSLLELLQVMNDADLHHEQKVYFLKGTSLFSQILASITAFHVHDSLSHLKKSIQTSKVPNYAFAVEYILSYRMLSMMTYKEKMIAHEILNYTNVPSMACGMKINYKTLYARVRRIAVKLNLRDIKQMRKFFISEFTMLDNTL